MKSIQATIQEMVEELGPKYSDVKKAEYKEYLRQIFEEGLPPIQVLDITPDMMEAIYGQAYRLYLSGNYRPASLLFALLLSLDPAVLRFNMGLAACHHMMKEYPQAIDSYMTAFCLDMKSPLPFFHVADCLQKDNNLEYAYFCLGVAAEIAGDDPKYAKLKERAKMMQKHLEKEIEHKVVEAKK